ncbi:MAG TPA: DUF2505 family protein [Acidimicrobiales bacterium]|nr:DUF2505 family protein [Acidimicrobiales bacterium]
MRFRVSTSIAAPRELVETAFVDPAFYAELGTLPNLRPPEVLSIEEDGDQVRLRIHYALQADLAPAVRRVLDPEKITWVEESTVHRAEHYTEFRMVPEHYVDRMECAGSYRFEESGPDRTEQVVQGDLVIHYPLVGRLVERAILTGMRQHLTEEARLLEQWAQREG